MISYRAHYRLVVATLAAVGVSVIGMLPAAAATWRPAPIPPVVNPGILHDLDPAERAALARNGFVVGAPPRVIPRDATNPPNVSTGYASSPGHRVYWQFYDLYEENYGGGIPTFLTSDALLHTFHVIYDQTLVALERAVLAPKLAHLSSGLVDVATYQYGASANQVIKAAARLDLGYEAVAARLLDPRAATPVLVAPVVNRELALITAHQGFALSPLFGYAVDYSKFIPRGHYGGDVTLSRYFQALTWYGLLTFHLNGPDSALHTRQALLLVRGLTQRADLAALWADIFDPITAWVGRGDDLTVRDYMAVMARVYPATAPIDALADPVPLARFTALANALPDPQIRGDLTPSSAGAARAAKGLRLFGQRFVPDASIMQALIWDNVGTRAQPRVWPLGLDIAAALGSTRATTLVSVPYGQTRYARYARQLTAAWRTYRSLPDVAWHQNLYWSWLDTLRAVWGPAPPTAPAFMHGQAWADKSVATGLASWAELRHDTLLYVKQVGGLGAGGQPPVVPAYVEPVPLVYARLRSLTMQLKATLIKEGALDRLPQPVEQYPSYVPPGYRGEKGYRGALDDYADLVALAGRVAARELRGQTAATADLAAVQSIGNELSLITSFFQDNAARKFLDFYYKQVAAIADVYTEPNSGQVLEEGVGDVLPLYAVVTINGQRWLARGGVYSYYEFHQPMSERLTDDAWRRMSRRPDLPAWMASYLSS